MSTTERPRASWVPEYDSGRYVARADDRGRQEWEVFVDCSLCGATVSLNKTAIHNAFHEQLHKTACRS